MTVEEELASVTPLTPPSKKAAQRVVRWKRTITVTGPVEWVESTRARSLAQGIHLTATKDDVPCFIEVETDEGEHLRYLPSPTSNQAMVDLRRNDPAEYERVHGKGTAIEHADHNEAQQHASNQPPTPSDGHHTGLYL
jgi:hypothetical protein